MRLSIIFLLALAATVTQVAAIDNVPANRANPMFLASLENSRLTNLDKVPQYDLSDNEPYPNKEYPSNYNWPDFATNDDDSLPNSPVSDNVNADAPEDILKPKQYKKGVLYPIIESPEEDGWSNSDTDSIEPNSPVGNPTAGQPMAMGDSDYPPIRTSGLIQPSTDTSHSDSLGSMPIFKQSDTVLCQFFLDKVQPKIFDPEYSSAPKYEQRKKSYLKKSYHALPSYITHWMSRTKLSKDSKINATAIKRLTTIFQILGSNGNGYDPNLVKPGQQVDLDKYTYLELRTIKPRSDVPQSTILSKADFPVYTGKTTVKSLRVDRRGSDYSDVSQESLAGFNEARLIAFKLDNSLDKEMYRLLSGCITTI
ncbi:hypothetical protein BJ085DRAFT_36365 [Dimargaris cristalligena]|uniref:Uncharacterized protein n=1 Tax=Dimargaris cristalligena TaxID=215637 RepID=A0A4P9ZJV7_9FUNG|nr:hypothetical protein BJ085DRAFT_36365 [Dimargaris cristalligena]|eukprot:RKP33546.1 hypothetical protein BJ085DRAFT_36365 [Dimargaris cristalligena]